MQALIPDCALELVENGGHLPWLDALERAARHIESFFDDRHGPRPALTRPGRSSLRWRVMIGTTVGGYEITEFLAEGGMGAVWVARHAVMGRGAVVKLLHPELGSDPTIVQRFFNEARAAASINDPGIVQVFDVGRLPDGRAYLVMERLVGQTLAARLRQRATEPPSRSRAVETVNILRLIVRTLVAAHAHGIVHRDLKPDNIFLVRDPDVAGGERTKILDFGIAKLTTGEGAHATRAGSLFGTPAYMAPEQCTDAASVDARADLYAIGCIAYEMLVGSPPFGGGGLEVVAAQIRDEPVPLRQRDPAIPVELEAIVSRLLRKTPDERYASTTELYDALDAVDLETAALVTPRPFDVPPEEPATKPARPQAAWPRAEPPPPALTTHSAASGVFAPTVPPRSRGPYVVAIVTGVFAAAVLVAVVLARSGSSPPVEPAASVAQVEAPAGGTEAPAASAPPSSMPAATPTPSSPAATPPTPPPLEPKKERRPSKPQHRPSPTEPKHLRAPDPTPPEPEITPPRLVPPLPTPPEVTPEPPPPLPPVRKPIVRSLEAGPIWNTRDAQTKCAALCKPPSRWTGGWRTTIPNKMSICECETP